MKNIVSGSPRTALACALLGLGLLAGGAVLTLALAEPLATPSRQSARADKSLLVALAASDNRLVAAGERGIVLYSDNGGAKWQQAQVPVSVNLAALHFSGARGWAVGHDGVVLHSADGGKSWSKQLDGNALNAMLIDTASKAVERAQARLDAAPNDEIARAALTAASNALEDSKAGAKFGPSRPLLSVWFRDQSEGYAVGAFGQAIRTTDGGDHWQDMAGGIANPDGLHLNYVGPGANGAVLAAGEGGKIYRSTNGGAGWQTLATGYTGQLYGVVDTGGDSLLAYGFGGNVLRSDDGGKQWKTLPRQTGKSLVAAVRTAGGLSLVARDGTVLRSTDAGRSFTVQPSGHALELASAIESAPGRLLAGGVGGIHPISTTGAKQP
ncbi:MAG: YCF48-related protein [Pseudomonadota bacterium]